MRIVQKREWESAGYTLLGLIKLDIQLEEIVGGAVGGDSVDRRHGSHGKQRRASQQLHIKLLLVSVVDSAPGFRRDSHLINWRPLPVLQSFPPNLRQGGFPSSQDESARQGRQHFHSLEVKQFWCKKLPNLVYQKLKMQFAFFFLHISRKLCGRGYNLIKHKYGWF